MIRPATRTLVMGHPVIAVPLTLAGGLGVFASLYNGDGLFPVMLFGGVALIAQRASEQASKYRAWKAEWNAMAGDPPRRSRVLRFVAWMAVIAVLALIVLAKLPQLAFMAGYAYGWTIQRAWLLVGPGVLAVTLLVQFIRRHRRRPKSAKPVTVIAKPVLPVPSLADAYRALPPYCQHLLGRHP